MSEQHSKCRSSKLNESIEAARTNELKGSGQVTDKVVRTPIVCVAVNVKADVATIVMDDCGTMATLLSTTTTITVNATTPATTAAKTIPPVAAILQVLQLPLDCV